LVNVSIVLPAFNAAATVGEALESVLAQTRSDWEVVVVDDGSTDATAKICRAFATRDKRIRLVQRTNGGEAAARNTGLEHVGFDWVLFLDADDWISPTHLELLTAELDARPELDAVIGGAVRVSANGTHVRDELADPPEGDLFPLLARRAAFAIHSCIVRRALVERAGRFDPSFRKSEDWDLWLRIARTGARFGAVRGVVAYYRMSAGSATSNAELMFTSGLRVLEQARAADARVGDPHPAYAHGLAGDPVESQVFYLLSWCAGRLLANGGDAAGLLGLARDYRWADLDPGGVARSIVDGGALATREPRAIWETLLDSVLPQLGRYLAALEQQSGTTGLAAAALHELKRGILRDSATWGSLVEEHDRATAERVERISRLEESHRRLAADMTAQLQREQDRVRALQADLSAVQKLSDERARRLARLRQHKWILLGLDVGSLEDPDVSDPAFQRAIPDSTGPNGAAPGVRGDWRLREAEGSCARLLVAEAPRDVRLEITEAGTREWDIQLDLEVGRVVAAAVYGLHFRVRADEARTIGVGLAQSREPWSNLGFYERLSLTPEWQDFRADVTASSDEACARIHLDCGRQTAHVEVAGLTFEPGTAGARG
jgi:GT2 family glycosyltransferase